MAVNTEPFNHGTEDDFYPTPKAFKFMSTDSDYLKDNLQMMVNNNAVWLSNVDAFNDPMEMIIHAEKTDSHIAVENFIIKAQEFVKKYSHFDDYPEYFKSLLIDEGKKKYISKKIIVDFFNNLKKDRYLDENPSLIIRLLEEKININIEVYFEKSSFENRQRFIKNLFVCCLTSDVYNLSMWAYYAQNHRGIAVEFYRNSPLSRFSQQVTYTTNPPLAIMQNFDFIVTKNIYWRHEDERRYVVMGDKLSGGSNDNEGKFIENTNFFKFSNDSLSVCGGHLVKAIYLGCSISNDNKMLIVDVINSSEYPITLIQCDRSSRAFGIELYQVS